jgi:YHS domain-containing protein
MGKLGLIFSILMGLSLTVRAAENKVDNVTKQGVIIDGHDPVSYFTVKKAQQGKPEFQTKVDDVTYWFFSEENKQTFLKDPKKYMPQYGGWCAFAVADSKSKVEVDYDKFLIQDGRLFLFYNDFLSDTRKKWSKDPKEFLKKADANWPLTKNTKP